MMRYAAPLALLISTLPLAALDTRGFHDNQSRTMQCGDRSDSGSERYKSCAVREQTIGSNGSLRIEAGPNGGVTVKGWIGAGVLVRAKVEAWGESDAEAKLIGQSVQIQANPGDVRATGPENRDRRGWSVSYEVFVPYLTNLEASTNNGGITLTDVAGTIRVETTNGGLHLTRVSGDVKGQTTNGGVNVSLIGDRWDGAGLEVSSTNGGVSVDVPATYSAHLEGSTVNGGVHNDFGGSVISLGRMQSVDSNVGSGGATVKATTVNGGVSFKRS